MTETNQKVAIEYVAIKKTNNYQLKFHAISPGTIAVSSSESPSNTLFFLAKISNEKRYFIINLGLERSVKIIKAVKKIKPDNYYNLKDKVIEKITPLIQD